MPLVKDLKVERDLCADTARRKEFIVQKDFVRRRELGKEVSIRATTMKGAVLIETLRAISEPEVKIGLEEQQAYADAEDWICRKMNDIFHAVRHLGLQTRRLPFERIFYNEVRDDFVLNCNEVVWIPTHASYIGDERVYFFSVASLVNNWGYSATGEITFRSSGSIGFTRDYLSTFSTELSGYVQRLEQKAMAMPEVQAAFTRLGGMLRPKQFKDEQERARAEAYGHTDFGGWA